MSFFSRLRGSRSFPASSATGGPDVLAAADAAHPDDGARVRTVRALVSGQVQGVGFRWYCTEEAQSLGLVGRVSNLPNAQ